MLQTKRRWLNSVKQRVQYEWYTETSWNVVLWCFDVSSWWPDGLVFIPCDHWPLLSKTWVHNSSCCGRYHWLNMQCIERPRIRFSWAEIHRVMHTNPKNKHYLVTYRRLWKVKIAKQRLFTIVFFVIVLVYLLIVRELFRACVKHIYTNKLIDEIKLIIF